MRKAIIITIITIFLIAAIVGFGMLVANYPYIIGMVLVLGIAAFLIIGIAHAIYEEYF